MGEYADDARDEDDLGGLMMDGDDDCQDCGGSGFIFDCFDGFCLAADEGCDDCTRPCPECARRPRP